VLFALLLSACEDVGGGSRYAQCDGEKLAGISMPIRAGEYLVGDDRFYPEEAPIKRIKLSAFEIDATEVTNAQFERFVEETGYVTRAEKGLYGV